MEIIAHSRAEWPDDAPIEVVERKGLGHPDTLCDAIAERVCLSLCRTYLHRFDAILPNSVDVVLLCGGESRPRFGGGDVLAPIEIYLAGRATTEWRGVRVPVDEIATAACRELLAERLPLQQNVHVISRIRPNNGERTAGRSPLENGLANDTSFGVGFAPYTALERVVLDIDRTLASPDHRLAHPEVGTDVKVMGVRRRDHIDLVVACSFIDRHVADLAAYSSKKAELHRALRAGMPRASPLDTSLVLNGADDERRGDVYLTVTGSSAEAGHDGASGRGNRISGLVTPSRPMTMEAAAGKNPVNHVGMLYDVVAHRIANGIAADCADGVLAASCMLVSRFGSPIADPVIVDVAVCAAMSDRLRGRIEEIVRYELSHLDAVRDAFFAGTIALY